MTRILVTSDTHGKHGQMPPLPDCDLFIHCGDFMNSGVRWEEIFSFNSWLGGLDLPKDRILLCAGNHDIFFDETHRRSGKLTAAEARKCLNNGTYLQDEAVVVDGIKFWFSPWTPEFMGWAFNTKRGDEISAKWKMIPDDTEFLVTHGPPMGILDTSKPGGDYLGCADLNSRRYDLPNLKVHAFGHIHGGRGIMSTGETTFVNASFVNEAYKPWPGAGAVLLEV